MVRVNRINSNSWLDIAAIIPGRYSGKSCCRKIVVATIPPIPEKLTVTAVVTALLECERTLFEAYMREEVRLMGFLY